MTLSRRKVLRLATGAVALPALSRASWAQAYPSRPIRFVVGFPAGGSADITARIVGQWLSERLGQQIIVENRAGAASNIGTEAVVKSPPDGYTFLIVSPPNAINATLYAKLNYDFMRDIAPVVGIIRIPNVMVVIPSVPVSSVPEFIAYAKANPGKLNMASPGNGSSPHMSGELFKMMAGVNMQHVPYRGEAPAVTDLLAGQVQVMFGNMPGLLPHAKAGRLRALAVTTMARAAPLPDISTIGDFVPGYEASSFFGVGAPKNTPAAIVEKLNTEINAAIANPKIRTRLVELGGTPLGGLLPTSGSSSPVKPKSGPRW